MRVLGHAGESAHGRLDSLLVVEARDDAQERTVADAERASERRAIRRGESVDVAVEKVTGRKAGTFEAWVRRNIAAFK
ncbi:MAG TPA: hypothetical protein VF973_00545 [Myxococcales bacterium]